MTKSIMNVDVADIQNLKDPLDNVPSGLLSNGKLVPLISVHVRANIKDFVGEVVVFQEYKNDSHLPIEAKYVFPLDDMAAVCGFEGTFK